METNAVIFEDNHLLVVIKPQNVPTVADSSQDESLQESLKAYTGGFVGIVHRLDRVTGGVMVFAKTSKAASRLAEQIKDGTFKKTYYAVVNGVPKQRKATLVNWLAKDSVRNLVAVVPQTTTGAKRAELTYEMVDTVKGDTLVAVQLATGRSHQIRVQMKHIGNPIVGDARYGGSRKGIKDIALWAYQLEFNHPTTHDRMKFIVNPPEDGAWTNFDFRRKRQ
ncbi:MAG: RluA family pseudouridine synthase [Clostridia bacterium]|nr:RluA family pseudouridine synthase [Clostridia bacterium]